MSSRGGRRSSRHGPGAGLLDIDSATTITRGPRPRGARGSARLSPLATNRRSAGHAEDGILFGSPLNGIGQDVTSATDQTGVSRRHAASGMTAPDMEDQKLRLSSQRTPPLNCANDGAALGSRTPDLRITRMQFRIPKRSTSTDGTSHGAARTPRSGRTRTVMPELMPATERSRSSIPTGERRIRNAWLATSARSILAG
jgi:hypothetical protein